MEVDKVLTTELIISVSGLRGIAGESLTDEVAQRYIVAFSQSVKGGPIVVTRDGRASGPSLFRAIEPMLSVCHRPCLDGGVAATPTTGILVRRHGAAGGIQISASHNPAEYNGIKLFDQRGRVLSPEEGKKVLEVYHTPWENPLESAWRPFDRRLETGTFTLPDTTSRHLELIESICNVDRIRSKRYRVLLDANHGAGAVLGRPLLEMLGCEVTVLGETPDGQFDHLPEPTEANLASVLAQVVAGNADIGFCQDPDADRLAIIDQRGRYIGEEKTPALCVEHILRGGRLGPVVTNCSTSRMSEEIARKYGVPFFRSKVGEANVVDLMLEKNAVIGGEGNGGVIDPRVGLVRDSFVGMALVLDAIAARGLPVSQLADELPQYAIYKTTIAVAANEIPSALDSLERRFNDAIADRLDGLRLDWSSGAWLLVRPSNTEPIVRAIAEATTLEEAKSLCEQAAAVITP